MVVSQRVPRGYAGAVEAAPKGVRGGQYVAETEADEVVVFLIGMRINRLRRVRSWWPAFTGMPRMLDELSKADLGLLGFRIYRSGRVFLVVQYWRSAAELGAYARDGAMLHAPAWAAFNQSAAKTGDVGIFHESYVVPRARIESVYANMPAFGLAAAVGSVQRAAVTYGNEAHRGLRTTEPEYVES
jgi:hypothetical protein